MPLTQVQLSTALADRAEISRAEAKRVLGAVEEVVLEEWRSWQRAEGADRRSGAVDRSCHAGAEGAHGRNPATGEAVKVAAKPASVDVRTRPLAKAKAALPSSTPDKGATQSILAMLGVRGPPAPDVSAR